jgi:hypothetical protein
VVRTTGRGATNVSRMSVSPNTATKLEKNRLMAAGILNPNRPNAPCKPAWRVTGPLEGGLSGTLCGSTATCGVVDGDVDGLSRTGHFGWRFGASSRIGLLLPPSNSSLIDGESMAGIGCPPPLPLPFSLFPCPLPCAELGTALQHEQLGCQTRPAAGTIATMNDVMT